MAPQKKIPFQYKDPLHLDLPVCIHCGASNLKEGHYQVVRKTGRVGPFCSVTCQTSFMKAIKPGAFSCEIRADKKTHVIRLRSSENNKKNMKIPALNHEAINRALKKTARNKQVPRRKRTRVLPRHTVLDINDNKQE